MQRKKPPDFSVPGLGRGRGRSQESSNAKIIDGRAEESAEKRRNDWNPPDARAVGEAVVSESGQGSEKARAKVARGIDGISVHAAEAHADGDDHEPDHRRRKVRSRRDVEFVRDR